MSIADSFLEGTIIAQPGLKPDGTLTKLCRLATQKGVEHTFILDSTEEEFDIIRFTYVDEISGKERYFIWIEEKSAKVE